LGTNVPEPDVQVVQRTLELYPQRWLGDDFQDGELPEII
jgi:hypothetical protein